MTKKLKSYAREFHRYEKLRKHLVFSGGYNLPLLDIQTYPLFALSRHIRHLHELYCSRGLLIEDRSHIERQILQTLQEFLERLAITYDLDGEEPKTPPSWLIADVEYLQQFTAEPA